MTLVINFSGGKDSCAMLHFLCMTYPDLPKYVVFANTGWEHPDAVEWCTAIVARYGLQLHVVKSEKKTFLSMVESRGMFPGMQYRQCTSDLKRDPITKFIRQNIQDPVVVNCLGMRWEESAGRARLPRLARCKRQSNSKRTIWDWHPVISWSEAHVRKYLTDNDIPLHRVYGYLKRFSCRVCIFMSDQDLQATAKHDPEAIETIAQLEDKIGFTMMQRGPIRQLANLQNTQP